MPLHADISLDLRGLRCPLPLMELGLAMERLQPGQRCAALADDPGLADDLEDWCRATGHRLLRREAVGGAGLSVLLERSAVIEVS